MPYTGQFPNSTCIGTNQRRKGIRCSSIFAEKFVDNVKIQEPLGSSDHNQVHFNIKIKSDKTKVSRCKRNFRKGNYKEMRTILEHTHVDWNDKMKNKTGAESWNILKSELDSVINIYVL